MRAMARSIEAEEMLNRLRSGQNLPPRNRRTSHGEYESIGLGMLILIIIAAFVIPSLMCPDETPIRSHATEMR